MNELEADGRWLHDAMVRWSRTRRRRVVASSVVGVDTTRDDRVKPSK